METSSSENIHLKTKTTMPSGLLLTLVKEKKSLSKIPSSCQMTHLKTQPDTDSNNTNMNTKLKFHHPPPLQERPYLQKQQMMTNLQTSPEKFPKITLTDETDRSHYSKFSKSKNTIDLNTINNFINPARKLHLITKNLLLMRQKLNKIRIEEFKQYKIKINPKFYNNDYGLNKFFSIKHKPNSYFKNKNKKLFNLNYSNNNSFTNCNKNILITNINTTINDNTKINININSNTKEKSQEKEKKENINKNEKEKEKEKIKIKNFYQKCLSESRDERNKLKKNLILKEAKTYYKDNYKNLNGECMLISDNDKNNYKNTYGADNFYLKNKLTSKINNKICSTDTTNNSNGNSKNKINNYNKKFLELNEHSLRNYPCRLNDNMEYSKVVPCGKGLMYTNSVWRKKNMNELIANSTNLYFFKFMKNHSKSIGKAITH